jgi:hypothetical protein
MSTVHRTMVSLKSKRKILGIHPFTMALQSVVAAAHNGTATGFAWLQMPAGLTRARLRRLEIAFSQVATETDHLTAPRIVLARFTFTGVASGTEKLPAQRRTDDAAPVAHLRTAMTDMTVSVGEPAWAAITPSFLLTTSGIAIPSPAPQVFAPTDEDDFLDIKEGEGLLLYQADAGTASDGRRFKVSGAWDEYLAANTVESSVQLVDDGDNTGKLSGTIAEEVA